MGRERRSKFLDRSKFNFFSVKKHNPCWTWCRSSGGTRTHPHSFHSHNTHSYRRRSGCDWTKQPLNQWAALLPLSHRSLVWACAGTYISLFTCMWFYNKPVKALTESLYVCGGIWTHASITAVFTTNVCLAATPSWLSHWRLVFVELCWIQWHQYNVSNSGIWTHASITAVFTENVCLATNPSWLSHWRLVFVELCWIQWHQYNVRNSGIWTQNSMIQTHHFIHWARQLFLFLMWQLCT